MKPPGIFPAIQNAVKYVKGNLDTGVWKKGERLPSINQLSRLARVSAGTMCKAISLLKEQQLLFGEKNCRIWVGDSDAHHSQVISGGALWLRHREIIEKDLAAGTFGIHGRLPTFKELQTRYGLCYRTLRKILNSMEAEGHIRKNGRKYALPAIQTGTFRQKIVFITLRGHFTQESALNRKHYRILNLVENECVRAGLALEIMEIDFADTLKSRLAAATLDAGDSTLGFVLDVWWYDSDNMRRSYIDMLSRLATEKKPVALLDEDGTFDLPLSFSSNPLLQVFRIEGKGAGARMMSYLHNLGHRAVVYISILHFTPWSRNRFNGIAEVFNNMTGNHQLYLVAESAQVALADELTVSGLKDAEIRKLITVGLTDSQSKDVIKQWIKFKNSTTPRTGIPRLSDLTHRNLSELVALAIRNPDESFFEKTLAGALEATATRTFNECLRPLFDRALEHRDATAWICANDDLALSALSYLREKKIAVPGHLSVVGFDNNPIKSLEHRLTTLDFNAMGFISHILNFILRPPRPRGSYKHQTIEVEGIIMERETAGKAPGK